MLKLKNVTKYYGTIKGCEDISFEVQKGEVVGFIGPNGSGKSTTIKCIMNSLNKNNGKIYLNNVLLKNDDDKIKNIIGYLPGEVHLYEGMRVKDIIKYNSNFYEKNYYDNGIDYCKELQLDLNKKIKQLSLGNLKKLGIVLSLMHKPELIILDEPTNGLDPLIQEKFFEIIKKEKQRGAAILFSTHILTDVRKVCDKVMLIKNGNIIEKLDVKEEEILEVIIESKEQEKLVKELKEYNIKIENHKIYFDYKKNINTLIKSLSKYKLDNLIIEKKQFEDKLMEYYKGEE